MTHIAVVRAAPVTVTDDEWVVLVNGYQHGGEFDHQIGCGTATYQGLEKALQSVREEFDRTPDEIDD